LQRSRNLHEAQAPERLTPLSLETEEARALLAVTQMSAQSSSLQPGEPPVEVARDRPHCGAAGRRVRHRLNRCRFAAFLAVQPTGAGSVTVGTVTVTVTTGVVTGTVVGVAGVAGTATGSDGTDATTLATVSTGELGAAAATGDPWLGGAAAARGVSEG
jgi:hypothetical protein